MKSAAIQDEHTVCLPQLGTDPANHFRSHQLVFPLACTDEVLERRIDFAITPIELFQQNALKSADAVRNRNAAVRTQRTGDLAAAQARQVTTVVNEKMATSPLPGVSPLPGKKLPKKRKAKGGKGGTKSPIPIGRRPRKSKKAGGSTPPAV